MNRFLKYAFFVANGLVLVAITLALPTLYLKFSLSREIANATVRNMLPVSPPVTAPILITETPTLTLTPTPTSAPKTVGSNLYCVAAHLDDKHWLGGEVDKQIALLKTLGVKWVRFDIAQVVAEKERDYSHYKRIVDSLNKNGIGVILIIVQWGQTGQPWKSAFSSPELYGEFAGRVASNFKGKKVIYQLGNEPDYNDMNIPTYTAFLKRGYDSIKAVDSKSVVISAGVGGKNSTTWLQGIYNNGGAGKFDGFGLHRYVDPEAPKLSSFNILGDLKNIMEKGEGGKSKPIYITEVGWQTGGETPVSEATQAQYITDVYNIVSKNYSTLVPAMCLYRFADQSAGEEDAHFGIVVQDPREPDGYREKPGFCALQKVIGKDASNNANISCK